MMTVKTIWGSGTIARKVLGNLDDAIAWADRVLMEGATRAVILDDWDRVILTGRKD